MNNLTQATNSIGDFLTDLNIRDEKPIREISMLMVAIDIIYNVLDSIGVEDYTQYNLSEIRATLDDNNLDIYALSNYVLSIFRENSDDVEE